MPLPWTRRRTFVRTREHGRRTGTGRVERRNRRAGRAACAGVDFVVRLVRRRDRWRRPPSAGPVLDRGRTNTTADRPARVFRHAGGGRRRRVRGPGRSSGQTSAALGAPGLQHGATGAGAHARTESVLAGSAAVVGLVGTLHDDLRTFEAESRIPCAGAFRHAVQRTD